MSPILMLVLLFCCGWVYSDLPLSIRMTVLYGDTAVLPCYSSAFVDKEDTEVSWEVMGSDVAAQIGDQVMIDLSYQGRVHFLSEGQREDWSLVLESVRFSDINMYECIWRGRRTLSTVWLIVEPKNTEPPTTEDSGSGWSWPTLFEDSEESTTNERPIFSDTVTPPTDVTTEFLPMEAYEETTTSYPAGVTTEFLPVEGSEEPATPHEDLPEDLEESMDWSDFPWVRTGLIAGVALVTAAALCILGVLHKL